MTASTATTRRDDKRYLDMAARVALRAAGYAEPNPLVGAVIVKNGAVIGIGHHERFGSPHAEARALADCAARGLDPRGATMYVTLEPCNHTGRNPPCSRAIIAAGIAHVVAARVDPHDIAAGGAATLAAAGIDTRFSTASRLALAVSDPFIKRLTTDQPWVIAKWAQTIDGKIATRTGESKWISSPASRRHVHRLRARVDVVLTGIGTVLADDPALTARQTRVRRVARRVIIDPRLITPHTAKLITSIPEAPVSIVHDEHLTGSEAARDMAALGADLLPFPLTGDRFDLAPVLALIRHAYSASTVLVEAGPRLLGSLLQADLVDEAHVYIAPRVVGDELAPSAASGIRPPSLQSALALELFHHRRVGPDIRLEYRRNTSNPPSTLS